MSNFAAGSRVRNTKLAVCRRLLLSNRLLFAAFCCLCAVHCMLAAAASFVSPKAVSLACTISSWTAKNCAQNALEVDTPHPFAPAALDLGPPFANPGSTTGHVTYATPLLAYFCIFWIASLAINLRTKFQVFSRSRDIQGVPKCKSRSHDLNHTLLTLKFRHLCIF